MLCLYDLLDDSDEEHDKCCEWIDAVDTGGLTHVTKATYHVFVCMELELRKHLGSVQIPNFKRCGQSYEDE